ncbi:MAG: PP2C family protein-serine/threonine phosphatase [Blautia sp.]
MNYLTAVHTDVGIRKRTNQDSVLIETAATDYGQVLLSVVCDGMGGLAKGEVASAILIKAFSNWFHREFPEILYKGMEANTLRSSWTNLILEQNQKINEYGLNCNVSLGTTVAALLLIDNIYYIINVGDSRVYYLKDGITQMTVDQTFVQREMDLGRMTLEEAKNHPKRNVLLQCVGASSVIEPDFYVGEFEKDSVFMMCSDGFRHVIYSEEFYERLKPELMVTEEKMKENAVYFTELNKSRREDDNISVALIRAY